VRAIKELTRKHSCDVIISDDGLQHYAMARDIEVVVIDGERGFGNGQCLPAGPLREPVSRLKEVDLVVVNGEENEFDWLCPVRMTDMQLKPAKLVDIRTGERDEIEALGRNTVHGVAGISNPERFFKTLRSLGLEVIPHEFPDHYALSLQDISFNDDLPVVMTEKDAIKLEILNLPKNLYWYLEVEAIIKTSELDALVKKLGLDLD
jgi:tetraacyldisaccharide 4'-kinase